MDNKLLEDLLKDPFEVPLVTLNKLSHEDVAKLYGRVSEEYYESFCSEFDKNEGISALILYKERNFIQVRYVNIGEDLAKVRKKLEEKLSKITYLFIRPAVHEALSNYK